MPETWPLAWPRLDRNSPDPLQVQIVRWLQGLIVSGTVPPKTRLPAETELVARLGVSRVTVRLAFDELVARGLVARSHGRGSFVAPSLLRHDLQADRAFFDIVLAQAIQPEARLLRFQPAVPPPAIARQFALEAHAAAVLFERLYLSAGRPVAFVRGWLTPDALSVPRAAMEQCSTAAMHVEVLRHPVVTTAMSITAESVAAPVARQLGMRARNAVLVLVRSRFDAAGRLREYLRFVIDPASYEFTLSPDGMAAPEAVLRAVAA